MAETFLDTKIAIPTLDHEFRAVVAEGGLSNLPQYLDDEGLAEGRAFVLTDSQVNSIYGDGVAHTLEAAGIENTVLEMDAGEEHKTLLQVADFIDSLSAQNASQHDVVIALGGGVVGDLGGFVASIYNRGVPLVQVPTTLLAMVDSSIGGKTGVDHGGKNKTGTFYQPELVVADPEVLHSLSPRVYTEGFGEIVKYAMLDAQLMSRLEHSAPRLREFSYHNASLVGRIIARSVQQKSKIIADDPHEQAPDSRVLLNYGHTLGHALEAAGGYTELLHGEAVAIGMTFAAQLAVDLELLDPEVSYQQEYVLQKLGLPTQYEGSATVDSVMAHIEKDKKNDIPGITRFVLPKAAGKMIVQHIDNETVHQAVSHFLEA